MPKMDKCLFCSRGSVMPGNGKCYDGEAKGKILRDAWAVGMETYVLRETLRNVYSEEVTTGLGSVVLKLPNAANF